MADDQNELLYSLLNSGAERRLKPHIKTADLQTGQVLAEAVAPVEKVYFPYSGAAAYHVSLNDGHLVQTAVVGRGGAVGALQAVEGKVSPNTVIVQVPGRAAVVDANRLAEVIQEYPDLRSLILDHEQFVLAEIQQSAACNAVHSVRQRVCRWILRLNDLIGIKVPVTQELLAETIGVRRTSVTAAAAALKDEGIIDYRRGHIEIIDIERLRQSSCECYETLREYRRIMRPPRSHTAGS